MKKIKLPTLKEKKSTKKGEKTPPSFSNQLLGAFIIFMCLVWGYSIVTEKKSTPTVPLSEFAALVKNNEIASIEVKGDTLTGEKKDATKVETKKEVGASVLSTLSAYGVSSSTLASTTVAIKNDRGLSF